MSIWKQYLEISKENLRNYFLSKKGRTFKIPKKTLDNFLKSEIRPSTLESLELRIPIIWIGPDSPYSPESYLPLWPKVYPPRFTPSKEDIITIGNKHKFKIKQD